MKTLAALFLAVALSPAFAQDKFPEKPIRVVVPFAIGGPTDVMARLVAAKMSENLGQPVVVENKLGAGGTIAATDVARSAPDGYTLMFHNVSTAAINMHVYKKLAYDPIKDFQPVSRLADIPNVMIINKDIPARTLREFIDYAKANPGKLNYASSGNGTVFHLAGELFKQMAGVQMTHVPYKGTSLAQVDLLGGTIAMMFDNIPGQVETIRTGKVTGLGVTTGVRAPVLPDLPTLAEAGLPEFKNASWFSFFARGGTPREVIRKLEMESIKAVNDPVVTARIRMLGAIPIASTADELDKFWKAEIEYWRPIVTRLNLQLD
ncbi:MAG: tripartite tricarboxylate transporter substrate binding protein [Betaproteobacteria bacterium]|nr:tripartite tricarboxylate transporter substrate binding protein [Betaproteobacteria bacterium]